MIHGISFARGEHHRADLAFAEASVGSHVDAVHMHEDVLFSGGGISAFIARESETTAVLHARDIHVRRFCVEVELTIGHFDIA